MTETTHQKRTMTKYDIMFQAPNTKVKLAWKVTKAERDYLKECLDKYRTKQSKA